jgi:hypothetical protein
MSTADQKIGLETMTAFQWKQTRRSAVSAKCLCLNSSEGGIAKEKIVSKTSPGCAMLGEDMGRLT